MTLKSIALRALVLTASAAALAACGGTDADVDDRIDGSETIVDVSADLDASAETGVDADLDVETGMDADAEPVTLDAILDSQDDTAKARFEARNPKATLEFFGIEPGMAVGEALPGGGWYSKILLPWLGDDGRLVGVDYNLDLWSNFDFVTEEFIETKRGWPAEWTADAQGWTDADVDIDAYTFATLPADESLDAFLFIRALHNLNRFEDGRYMVEALSAVNGALKPGGIVGVVQHAAPDDADADWANGAAGYLRPVDVIAAFEAAGFELVERSDINANPRDMPTTDDIVWRLSPTLGTSGDDADLRAEMEAIGESNRMTLKFRKRTL